MPRTNLRSTITLVLFLAAIAGTECRWRPAYFYNRFIDLAQRGRP